MANKNKGPFNEDMIDEIYGQMERMKSPPTMMQFIDVYADAVARLEQKIADKDERIRELVMSNEQLTAQLNVTAGEHEIDEKKFVIRIVEINGVYCNDPIFIFTTDSGEQANVRFVDFSEGDVILNLMPSNSRIDVKVINNLTNETAHSFEIKISDFDDRQRQEHEISGPGIHEPIVIIYEGQLIFNRRDYSKGFINLNRGRIEDMKQHKYQYQAMQDQLLDLFKDAILRKSFSQVQQNISRNASNMNYSVNNLQNTDRLDIPNMRGSVVRNMNSSGLRIVTGDPMNQSLNRSQQKDRSLKVDPFKKSYVAQTSGAVSWSPFTHILFYINIGLLVASFFVNWHRASFLSLIVAIVFLAWYLQRDEYEQLLPPLFLAFGYVLALTFDLLWVIQDSRDVWNNGAWIHSGSLGGMDKFMVIMSYILIGTEAAAAVVSVLLHFTGMFKNPTDRAKKLDFQLKI